MKWHPLQGSAPESDPSKAGATSVDGSGSEAELTKAGEEYFIRIVVPFWERLQRGEMTWTEFMVLLALHFEANSKFGVAYVKYPALVELLPREFNFTSNKLCKIFSELKGKRLIWYAPHSGSKGLFRVELDKYGKVSGGITDISWRFEDSGSLSYENPKQRIEIAEENSQAGEVTEVKEIPQKSHEQITPEIAVFSSLSPNSPGRGSNTDNDTQNNKNPIQSASFKERNPIGEFVPNSFEEETALRLGEKYGERDMTYLRAKIREGATTAQLRTAEEVTDDAIKKGQDSGNPILKPIAYFNRVLTNLLEGKRWDGSSQGGV